MTVLKIISGAKYFQLLIERGRLWNGFHQYFEEVDMGTNNLEADKTEETAADPRVLPDGRTAPIIESDADLHIRRGRGI
jgi:hypothetical protein